MTAHKDSTANQRPTCAICGVPMWLNLTGPIAGGFSLHTYECAVCHAIKSEYVRGSRTA